MDLIKAFTEEQLKKDVPSFNIGDTVRIATKIKENGKERTQMFEGTVIAKNGGGISETFTVRRIAYGCGVEKTFPGSTPRMSATFRSSVSVRSDAQSCTICATESAKHPRSKRRSETFGAALLRYRKKAGWGSCPILFFIFLTTPRLCFIIILKSVRKPLIGDREGDIYEPSRI